MPDLDELIKPGSKLYIHYGKGRIHNSIIHIRAIVDDEWVVSRTWHRRRGQWQYEINHITRFEVLYEQGRLKTKKPRP